MIITDGENPNIRILTNDILVEPPDDRVKEYRRKWKDNPLTHEVERFPLHLDIESTSVCNLKCPFCAGTKERYSYGYMTFDLYKSIVDEGSKKGLCSIKLNFRGEPLLHPQIHEMVAYAKSVGILDVFFNTNATLLTEERGTALIKAGLDRLIISFEGYTREIYEVNRVGAKFDEVVKKVRGFRHLRARLNSSIPLIRLQTVAINEEEDYLEGYKAFWQGYADEITCIDLRDEAADYSGLSGRDWECPYPWRRLCITWDGHVYTCPFVNRTFEKYEWDGLGTVAETSIEEIWTGWKMEKIRATHLQGLSHTIEPCKFCSYRGTELLKNKRLDGA